MFSKRPEVDIVRSQQEIAYFLLHDPREAREWLKNNPELTAVLLASYQKYIHPLLEKESHLPDLFARFLAPIAPDSTVFCLGSGLGGELPFARSLVPSGRVIAFDNTHDQKIQANSVLLEAIARAEFYPRDLSAMSAKGLGEQFESPHLVICRHPDVDKHPFWIDRLTDWSRYVKENGGQLLVTAYDKLEQLAILGSLLDKEIVPSRIDIYTKGYTYKPSWSLRSFQSDNYVFVVG